MNIELNKIIKNIFKIIFFLSCPFITLFFSNNCFNNTEIILGMFLSLIIGLVIIIKFKKIYHKINILNFIISLYLTLCIYRLMLPGAANNIQFLYDLINQNLNMDHRIWKLMLVALSFPAALTFVYYGYIYLKDVLIKFYKGLTSFEKKYLLITLILGFILTTVIYNLTDCFYQPSTSDNETVYYDVVYVTDSGVLSKENAFINFNMFENDIRQPLFGVFAFPFALIAYLISQLLFFIPNIYAICFNTIQIMLINISYLFITRMLKLEDNNKLFYLLLSFSSFSTMLFSFIIEQYIIGLFYLILSIYIANQSLLKINYFYIGALGTLITSGIIFPVITRFKNIKDWFSKAIQCFFVFVSITVLSGQLYQFLHIKERLELIQRFIGEKIFFADRFKQFLMFIQNIFISPPSHMQYVWGYPSYQLDRINHISLIGIAILIICLISAILNRKNKMAIISSLWIVFSFIILCVIGWGTQENGLILYSLYFSWAYFVLIYLFIDKIIKNNKIKYFIYIVIMLVLLAINIPGFMNVIKFGIEYYAVLK